MRIKFIEAPKGREYKVGDVVEFNGIIPEGYARKYIARGWAEEVAAPAPIAARPAARVETAKEPVKVAEPVKADAQKVEVPAAKPQQSGGSRQGAV